VNADGSGDPRGLRCPVGRNTRRINRVGSRSRARASPAAAQHARLIRRGLPYGRSTIPRSHMTESSVPARLFHQFEQSRTSTSSVLGHWVMNSECGIGEGCSEGKDPMTGRTRRKSILCYSQPTAASDQLRFSSFLHTRRCTASANVTAIKFIANLGSGVRIQPSGN